MIKKLLVIGPISARPDDVNTIYTTLAFLKRHYVIEVIDPLTEMPPLSNQEYYLLWQEKLQSQFSQYAAFLGFSFGGIILQQCFPFFATANKPVILFCTPSYINRKIFNQLNNVISCCGQYQLLNALKTLYAPVFSPKAIPASLLNVENVDESLAYKRLIWGLNRVLMTDSRACLSQAQFSYTHFVGQNSDLVNLENVIRPPSMNLFVVPNAGMRVLQDNPDFCKPLIWKALGYEIH